MPEERALSEVLGYLFVFALIVSMTAIVYTTGFADLQQMRDVEETNNAERAFGILKHNVEDLSERGAPQRATEIQMSEAQLHTQQQTMVNVTVTNETGAQDPIQVHSNPIIYETDGDEVVFSNGAVFRGIDEDARMVQEPRFVLSEDRVLIPLTHTEGDESIGGTRTVLVRADKQSSGLDIMETEEQHDVSIEMETPRATAWEQYFEDEGFDCADTPDDELSCELEEVDRTQVSRTHIEVEFE